MQMEEEEEGDNKEVQLPSSHLPHRQRLLLALGPTPTGSRVRNVLSRGSSSQHTHTLTDRHRHTHAHSPVVLSMCYCETH